MQIDFHFTAIYALSRLAGFPQNEANIIAQSSQFVDDAIHSGIIFFKNRAAYRLNSAAHRMLDYRNLRELANHHVWIPFHFIPGNEVSDQGSNDAPDFVQKIICRPNSVIARKIMEKVYEARDREFALQLLGIALHGYADTWAHQGFAGIDHKVNEVEAIYNWDEELSHKHNRYVKKYYELPLWKQICNWVTSFFINKTLPLGHGPVLSYPDRPYMKWKYKDWKGDMIHRDNPSDYLEAVQHIYTFLCKYREQGEPQSHYQMDPLDFSQFDRLFKSLTMDKGVDRYEHWIEEIRLGAFSFGAEECQYREPKSGISDIDQTEDSIDQRYYDIPFTNEFLESIWKKNYDAVTFYRAMVLHEVLPDFEICAA